MNRQLVQTMVVSCVGALVFSLVGLPLPLLLGPLFGCLVAALAGVRLQGAPKTTALMRTILGVAIGTSITPELVRALPSMWPTLMMMPLLVVAIGAVGYPFFRKLYGFDPATSFYSAMPGGLQDMMAFGEEAGGNPRVLGLIHATRVLVVVTLLPMIFSFALGVDLTQPPGVPAATLPWHELVIMAIAAVVGWKGAAAIGLFGASILGPLLLAAVLSVSGVLQHRPPAEAIYVAQFFIGFTVGVKYTGITWAEIRRVVVAGVGYTGLTLVVSGAFALLVFEIGVMPLMETLLSFSPGGQAEMAVVAIMSGADVAFIVAHHMVRLIFVILCAPIMARVAMRR